MTQSKHSIKPLITAVFLLTASMWLLGSASYKIVSVKGEVTIKRGGNTFFLEPDRLPLALEKTDTLFAARESIITLQAPDADTKSNTKKTIEIKGPFHVGTKTLLEYFINTPNPEAPPDWPNLAATLPAVFDRDKDDKLIDDAHRGNGPEKILSFYDEIKGAVVDIPLKGEGKKTRLRETERSRLLESVKQRFKAAPHAVQLAAEAMVDKFYQRPAHALQKVIKYYFSLQGKKDKKWEREFLEDVLLTRLLPIKITVSTGKKNVLTFSSNLDLWWKVFKWDGTELKCIKDSFEDGPKQIGILTLAYGKEKEKSKSRSFLYVIGFTDWEEMVRFDKIETAKKELVSGNIKETTGKQAIGYGKAVVKLPL